MTSVDAVIGGIFIGIIFVCLFFIIKSINELLDIYDHYNDEPKD